MLREDAIMAKEEAMEAEKDNRDGLVLFRSAGKMGWHKMGWNSALIYANEVGKRIGRRPRLLEDKDGYVRSVDGVVSINSLSKLEEALGKIGIKKVRESENGVIYFKLKYRYKEEEIKGFRDKKKLEHERMKKVLLPICSHPKIYRLLEEISLMLLGQIKKIMEF